MEEIKKNLFFSIVSSTVYSLAFVMYLFTIYSFDDINRRTVTDAFITTFVFLTPVIVASFLVFRQKLKSKLKLLLHFLWLFVLTAAVGVYLLMSYCEGEECLANIALIAMIFAYNFVLYLVFLFLKLFVR